MQRIGVVVLSIVLLITITKEEMANDPKRTLLLMFERPSEPLFYPRKPGDSNKDVVFETPENFVPAEYRPSLPDLKTRFGSGDEEKISIRAPSKLPNIKQLERLDKRENFTLFIPRHARLAGSLIEIFMKARDINEFTSIVGYVRDNINAGLFNYALSVAIMHRPDTKDLGSKIPSLVEVFPNKFIGAEVFPRMLAEANIREEGNRIPVEIPRDYTASNLDIEHRLAYFREDLGVNLHHWHWHLVYPFSGPDEVIRKDRRGELFYYMHQQLVARYNFERFCNNLARVQKFNDFREPIPQGYFPKLDSLVGNRNWPPRPANITLSDVDRRTDSFQFEIQDLERWRDRIYEAIHAGAVQDKNLRSKDLTESEGIDILGNIIEASALTINSGSYGDLHNFGHLAFATSHDPDGRYLEPLGVMGDTATAMRDPIFYRWHSFIDEIFQEHKATLPSYTAQRLTFPGVSISKVELVTKGSPVNQFHTKWQQSLVNMERGLDFYPRGAILAKFTHLQHEPFQMNITVNNTGEAKTGTVRIFLSPKFDERGAPWNFNDHRLMFIELDKFFAPLRKGSTKLERQSRQSSVTIPFERVFRRLGPDSRPESGDAASAFNFCGCGWPQHMLIPKGTEGQGIPCQLFVMITNYAEDKVDQPSTPRPCSDAASYCGIRDGKYPDKKPMGYPFDRRGSPEVDRLEDFLTPNMFVLDVNIIHHNTVTDASNQQLQQLPTRGGQTRPSGSGGRPTWN